MNGVQTRFKCKLDVKRCKRFVFPPSSLLPRSNALKTKAIRYFQTDRTLTRIVSPPLPDKGMYEAINKGIRAATGDIIGLIHSDDFLFSSHTISDIVKTFEEQDADMIYGNGVFVDYDDTNQMIRNWISGRYSKENVKNGWLPLHPTVYIKKECMDKWGLYDESYKIAADSDLLVRYLYEADLKVYYLNKYIVKMRMGGLSTDAGKSKLKWAEDLRMYKSHGIKPISALKGKILSKIPQFIEARLPWSEIPEAEEESLIQPDAANKKE